MISLLARLRVAHLFTGSGLGVYDGEMSPHLARQEPRWKRAKAHLALVLASRIRVTETVESLGPSLHPIDIACWISQYVTPEVIDVLSEVLETNRLHYYLLPQMSARSTPKGPDHPGEPSLESRGSCQAQSCREGRGRKATGPTGSGIGNLYRQPNRRGRGEVGGRRSTPPSIQADWTSEETSLTIPMGPVVPSEWGVCSVWDSGVGNLQGSSRQNGGQNSIHGGGETYRDLLPPLCGSIQHLPLQSTGCTKEAA